MQTYVVRFLVFALANIISVGAYFYFTPIQPLSPKSQAWSSASSTFLLSQSAKDRFLAQAGNVDPELFTAEVNYFQSGELYVLSVKIRRIEDGFSIADGYRSTRFKVQGATVDTFVRATYTAVDTIIDDEVAMDELLGR